MTDDREPLASLRRLRAVLALRETTLAEVAKKIGCTPSHLRVVVLGRREPSARLRSKLQRELRGDEWSFARGDTDVLQDKSVSELGNRSSRQSPARRSRTATLKGESDERTPT